MLLLSTPDLRQPCPAQPPTAPAHAHAHTLTRIQQNPPTAPAHLQWRRQAKHTLEVQLLQVRGGPKPQHPVLEQRQVQRVVRPRPQRLAAPRLHRLQAGTGAAGVGGQGGGRAGGRARGTSGTGAGCTPVQQRCQGPTGGATTAGTCLLHAAPCKPQLLYAPGQTLALPVCHHTTTPHTPSALCLPLPPTWMAAMVSTSYSNRRKASHSCGAVSDGVSVSARSNRARALARSPRPVAGGRAGL